MIVITTNGVLINRRLARLFIETRVDEISISLDSLKKEVYEALRVNARFESVMGAIAILNEAKERCNTTIPRLNLTPNFSRRNIKELPSFIRFAEEKKIDVVLATPTQVYRESWVKDSLLHFPRLTRRTVRRAEKLASKLQIHFVNELQMVYLNRGRGIWGLLRRPEAMDFPTDASLCRKPWTGLYVEQDGKVRPCCNQSPVYGNIFETGFEAIWNGPTAQAFRAAMIEKRPPRTCKECFEFNRHNSSILLNPSWTLSEDQLSPS
jgi:radical SAM protein with 4Fe4S-binding SPASM domain